VRTRLRVGPFFGVRVVVTISWLIVLVIIVVALEVLQVFPTELDLAARLLLGGAVGVLFLLSLATHELAHALVARRVGVAVSEVGLAVIGTQGQLEQRASTGRGEMAIAVAGPLLSLLVGGLIVMLSLPLAEATDPWLLGVGGVLWLVGLSNLLIGGLNLLPGHPFDGGRLLRGAVLARSGDAVRANRLSLTAGRLLSYAMMGLGIALALTGRFIDGVWLVVLGWLLAQSNRLHARRMEVEQLVADLSVGEVMNEEFPIVPPSLTVDALLVQHEQRQDAFVYPVTQNDVLIGAVDITRVQRMPERDRMTTRIEDVMTPPDQLTTLTRQTSVMDALQLFDRNRVEAFAVVDAEAPRRLVGMLTRDGLIVSLRARRSARQAVGRAST
jgi:Zn-dependent protease